MEIDKRPSRKERFLDWWKAGGWAACLIAFIVLLILVLFRKHSLVVGITICLVGLWGIGKSFFKKEHRYFVFLMSAWLLYRGILEIFLAFGR